MPDTERVDLLIIGSGEAGKWLAWTMGQAGRRVAVVERKYIGGSCPNIACLPSKNVIYSAKVADLARHGADYGVMNEGLAIDMARVRARKRKMVDDEIAAHLAFYKAAGNELIMGEARFVAPKTVEARLNDGGTRVLSGDQVALNLGTHSAIPDLPGLRAAKPMTHIDALELDRVPEHLLVLGGGYVGLEFAQAMKRFGGRVTVLERGPRVLAREDADVSDGLLRLFQDEGIDVLFNIDVLGVEGVSGQGIKVRLRGPEGERTLEGSDILVAIGRIPNTQGIGLEKAGVELDERGYIRVNERLQTSAPDTWAMGECAGSPQFTHVAFDDFRIVRDNLNGGNRSTRGRLVPFCIFTDPEFARVGLSESEARQLGVPYRVMTIPLVKVLRAHTTSETRGFMKALVAAESDDILGFTSLGADAGEVMAVVQTAMLGNLPYTVLRDAILAHPTWAEGLGVLFRQTPVLANADTAQSRTGAAGGRAAAG